MKPISPIYRFKYLIVISGLFLYSCGGGGSEMSSDSDSSFEELETINYELDFEIGEREGYIPGSLNMILTEDGSIIVADHGNILLEQYGADGTYVKTIATEGNGPGEVPESFSITDFGMGKYFVRAGGSRRAYVDQQEDGTFAFGETFLARPVTGRGRYLYFARNDTAFYGLISPTSQDEDLDYTFQHMMVSDGTGQQILADSLHVIRRPRGVQYQQPGSPFISNVGTQAFEPDFIVNPDRGDGSYIIIRPQQNKFELYNGDFQLENTIEVNLLPLEYTDVELDTLINTMLPRGSNSIPQSLRNEVRERVVEVGRPGFHQLWPSVDGYLLLLIEDGLENHYAILDSEGDPLGKFSLSSMDDVRYFRNGNL